MNDKQKIEFADKIIALIPETSNNIQVPKFVGTLGKRFGLNGFKVAEIGTPVFELNDRYVIELENIKGDMSYRVPFYKGGLTIEFKNQLE